MTRTVGLILFVLMFIGADLGLSAQVSPTAPMISLAAPLHFAAEDGSDIVLDAGIYKVAAEESALNFTLAEANKTFLIPATTTTHQEAISTPMALSIPVNENEHHIVLLLPNGTSLEAAGSPSGVRSRAPVSPAAPAQVTNAVSTMRAEASIAVAAPGAPEPPILGLPLENTASTEHDITFRWSTRPAQSSITSYQLCITHQGQPCPPPGRWTETGIVYSLIEPQVREYQVRGFPPSWQGKTLTWTVATCAPNTQVIRLANTPPPISCTYAAPRRFIWKWVMMTPILDGPAPDALVNSYPRMTLRSDAPGARAYYYCIARPGVQCITYPVDEDPNFVVTEEYAWNRYAADRPDQFWRDRLWKFAGQTLNWTVAACDTYNNCRWAEPRSIRFLPKPTLLDPRDYRYDDSPTHAFHWSVPPTASPGVTYRFCLATRGQVPVSRTSPNYGTHPEVIEALCGNYVSYLAHWILNPRLPDYASCPHGQCIAPERIGIDQASSSGFSLNLSQNAQLGRYAGETLTWTAGACNGDTCTWQIDTVGSLTLPSRPVAPALTSEAVPIVRHADPVRLNWSGSTGSYYVPCIRPIDITDATRLPRCDEGGNLLFNPLINPSQSNPSPTTCTLTGPYPRGPHVAQVAACSAVWGCQWSPNFLLYFHQTDTYRGSSTRLECR
ncbi:MAG TPA: hypothetical protein VGJ57_07775 [Nitrospirales bacterium]|jgi:hypothetical protein